MEKITSKNAKYIIKIAKKLGAKIKIISYKRNTFEIIYKNKSFIVTEKFRITANRTSNSYLTIHKDLTYTLLKKHKLPIPPETFLIDKKTKIEKIINRLKFPIVIKESSASQVKNVFTDIEDKKTALKIIKSLLKEVDYVVVQKMVYGTEYRVMVLDNKVIAVLKLIPPYIVGSGKNKIKELILQKSKKTPRPIEIDQDLIKTIKKQGFKLNDVLPKGKKVYLRTHSFLIEGGESHNETDKIHPKIAEMCVKATKIVNISLAGIDILCDDIKKDPSKQNFCIIEINGRPDIYIHYIPHYGGPRDVVKDILEYIVKIL